MGTDRTYTEMINQLPIVKEAQEDKYQLGNTEILDKAKKDLEKKHGKKSIWELVK